jgi:competence protein ComEA
MRKKTFFPISRGELRAVTITSLVICLGVILPPHLARILNPLTPPRVEITEWEAGNDGSDRASPKYSSSDQASSRYASGHDESSKNAVSGTAKYKSAHSADSWSDTNFPDYKRPTRVKPSYAKTGKSQNVKTLGLRCSTFDPNTISGDSLYAWGFPSYFVGNMLKYRSSGGKFRRSEDVQRIYGMDSVTYRQIAGCIEVGKETIRPVFVNTADTSQWMSLPGIGPVLSKRIVKFRDKLGGFYTIEQVADTYGLPMETFEIIRPNLRMQSGPKALDLTTATEAQLSSHPYISLKQARVMINYFKQHGRPESFDELSNLYIADSTWLARIRPYCTISLTGLH